jgi:hypothetical protein
VVRRSGCLVLRPPCSANEKAGWGFTGMPEMRGRNLAGWRATDVDEFLWVNHTCVGLNRWLPPPPISPFFIIFIRVTFSNGRLVQGLLALYTAFCGKSLNLG